MNINQKYLNNKTHGNTTRSSIQLYKLCSGLKSFKTVSLISDKKNFSDKKRQEVTRSDKKNNLATRRLFSDEKTFFFIKITYCK